MLEHWAQGLQIGFPNWMVSSFLKPWGQYKAIKFSIYLLVAWGRLKIIFLFQLSVKTLGPISTFAPIGMLELRFPCNDILLCQRKSGKKV
jgi:hypothetical protein